MSTMSVTPPGSRLQSKQASHVVEGHQQLLGSNHGIPEVQQPYGYREQTVDEQLATAAEKLIRCKAEKEVLPAHMLPTPPATYGSAARTSKAQHRKRVAEKAAERFESEGLKQVQKVFEPDHDHRYKEMARVLAELADGAAEPEETWSAQNRFRERSENPLNGQWTSEFRVSLDSMVKQLHMTFDPKIGEEQMARTYEWFLTHRGGCEKGRYFSSAGAPAHSPDLNFLEGDLENPRPGSAFYVVPTDRDAEQEDAEVEKHAFSTYGEGSMAYGRGIMNVQLPPPRERLRTFQTKHVSGPLTARKLKAATYDPNCQSPEPGDRPFTPSTCTGGSYTARSISSARSTPTPLGPLSARDSPTPLGGSRPSSAAGPSQRRPLTARERANSASVNSPWPPSTRPGTAPRLGARPGSGQRPPMMSTAAKEAPADTRPRISSAGAEASERQAELLRTALEKEAGDQQLEVAMQNMEERWVMRRHRDIANQMLDEERHVALGIWAERRARVEEEIAYNAEAMRFQSELAQRGVSMPADADQDIVATAPSDGQSQERPDSSAQAHLTQMPQPPRHDVSRISEKTEDQQVRFARQAPTASKPNVDRGQLSRIANLRRINRTLLRASEVQEDDDGFGDDDESDFVPESIFLTDPSAQHISLSAYTPASTQAILPFRNTDDADVVAAVCDHWSAREQVRQDVVGKEDEAGSEKNMHELRFKQQQETEAVKRALARRNCAFSAAVVDSALVMPSHFVKPEACIFNLEPNLKTEGLPSWYFQDLQKANKKKGGKPGRRKTGAKTRR